MNANTAMGPPPSAKGKPATWVSEAKRLERVIADMKLNMNQIPDVRGAADEASVLRLGVVKIKALLPPRVAESMWEAYACGSQNVMTPTERMLADIVESCPAHTTVAGLAKATRLTEHRAKQILDWHTNLLVELRKPLR